MRKKESGSALHGPKLCGKAWKGANYRMVFSARSKCARKKQSLLVSLPWPIEWQHGIKNKSETME
eukprot:804591-Pelagomonas_calceolata.AAC.10